MIGSNIPQCTGSPVSVGVMERGVSRNDLQSLADIV